MKPNLIPTEPLSQVSFVHDYVQLEFRGESFHLFNRLRLTSVMFCLCQGEPGFTDALIALIGRRVVSAHSGNEILTLEFEGDCVLEVLKDDPEGPEAFVFYGYGDLICVGQNN